MTPPAMSEARRYQQLRAHLGYLKLNDAAGALPRILDEARAGHLSLTAALEQLLEIEVNATEQRKLTSRMRFACLPEPWTLADFDFAAQPGVDEKLIRDLATLRFLDQGESVILHGPVGVGKTMLAQALGQLACRRGHTAAFTKTSRLLADLAGGHADHSWANRLRRWARPALLILDDFAMRELSMPQADDLYELITERAGRPVIFTSNRTPADWYPLFPNPVVAESILDRIVNTAHHVAMPGRSYRPRRRPTTTDASAR